MEILRCTPLYYDKNSTSTKNFGGVQIQTNRLTEALNNRGIRHVISCQNISSKHTHINDIMVIGCKENSHFKSLSWIKNTINYIKSHPSAIVHIHATGGVAPLILCILIKKKFNNHIILSLNCFRRFTYLRKTILELPIIKLVNYIERKSIECSKKTVILLESTLSKAQSFNISPHKLMSIGDMCDPNTIQHNISDKVIFNLREKLDLLCDTPIISFIGRLSQEKGVLLFIEIAAIINTHIKCNFVVCGDGRQMTKAKKLAQRLNLNNIKFSGCLSNIETHNLLSLSSIVLVPSFFEEFGSIMLEILSLKKLVVASNITSFNQLLSGNDKFLAPIGNAKIFAQKALNIINNMNLYQNIINKISDNTLIKYNENNICDQYIDLYTSISHNDK